MPEPDRNPSCISSPAGDRSLAGMVRIYLRLGGKTARNAGSFRKNRYLRIVKGYALITGASSGIGEAFARRLAADGWNIVAVSDRAAENERVVHDLAGQYGVEAQAWTVDLTEPDAARRIFARTQAENLRVEVLVNNAGMLLFSRLEHTPEAALDRIVALHCATPAKLCRLFVPEMRAHGRGYVLLVSSVTAWTPYPTISHYAATKAFLRNFGQSLWYELRGTGVRVTTLFPSAVDTPFYDLDERMRRRLRRWGLMLSADDAAAKGLDALFRGRRRCLPGWAAKFEALLCRMLPARALLPVLRIPAVSRLLERL